VGEFDDAVLALVLAIIREHYMLTGDFPTVAQIRSKLQAPGS
jgi:hypothetical protein